MAPCSYVAGLSLLGDELEVEDVIEMVESIEIDKPLSNYLSISFQKKEEGIGRIKTSFVLPRDNEEDPWLRSGLSISLDGIEKLNEPLARMTLKRMIDGGIKQVMGALAYRQIDFLQPSHAFDALAPKGYI